MNKKMILTKADRQYIANWFAFHKDCVSINYAAYTITREMAAPWIKRYVAVPFWVTSAKAVAK